MQFFRSSLKIVTEWPYSSNRKSRQYLFLLTDIYTKQSLGENPIEYCKV